MKCKNCEKEYSEGRFCPFCGHENFQPVTVAETETLCVCSQCQHELSDGPFCSFCGADNSIHTKTKPYHCPACATEYTGNFCPNCGQRKHASENKKPKRAVQNKTGYVYALLSALFLMVNLVAEGMYLVKLLHFEWIFSTFLLTMIPSVARIVLLVCNKKNKYLAMTMIASTFISVTSQIYSITAITLLSFLNRISLCMVTIYACSPELKARAKVIQKTWFIPLICSAVNLIDWIVSLNLYEYSTDVTSVIMSVTSLLSTLCFVLWLKSGIHDTAEEDAACKIPAANRNCISCRESIFDGRFCPVCGCDNGLPSHQLHFGWYRFLVSCGLLVAAVSGGVTACYYAFLLVNPEGYYYPIFSGGHEIMIRAYVALVLLLYLGDAVYAFVVRRRLEHFEKNAPSSLMTFFFVSFGISAWQMAVECLIFRQERLLNLFSHVLLRCSLKFNDNIEGALLYALLLLAAITVAAVLLNQGYFKKRAASFSCVSTKE